MKKLIIILTATLLFSCSTEENSRIGEEPTCSCVEVEEYATSATDFSQWLATGNIYTTDYPCSQNGLTIFMYAYNSGTGNVVKVRNRVECE